MNNNLSGNMVYNNMKNDRGELTGTKERIIMRLKVRLLVFLLLSSFITVVSADRGMIPIVPDVSIYEPGQKAIIAWNGLEEILILSTDVLSTRNTTILEILPLPSNPKKIEQASLESFNVVQELIWSHMPQPPGFGYLRNETESDVEVVFHERIGMHDITVVKASNVSEFAEWISEFLTKNGISQEPSLQNSELMIENYMLRGFRFYVLDLIKLSSDQRSVEPILYQFDSKFLYYPLLITSPIGGEGKIILFALTKGIIKEGYYPLVKARYRGLNISEPIQFRLSNEELFTIDPRIGELFDGRAWMTVLTYEGPLDKLTEDIVITEMATVDLNGDGVVDIYDVVTMCLAYGSQLGDSNWNPEADVAEPYGKIDIYDLVTCAYCYGEEV